MEKILGDFSRSQKPLKLMEISFCIHKCSPYEQLSTYDYVHKLGMGVFLQPAFICILNDHVKFAR
jgi:hypothetical protein